MLNVHTTIHIILPGNNYWKDIENQAKKIITQII